VLAIGDPVLEFLLIRIGEVGADARAVDVPTAFSRCGEDWATVADAALADAGLRPIARLMPQNRIE